MKLIILSAPSGAGKSTIIEALMSSNLPLEFSISACNRSPRTGEKDGVDYYFLSTEAFKQKIAEDAFVEWEEVYSNHYYGTLKSELNRIENNGNQVIFDIDIAGGLSLKKIFGDDALSIFIMPPSVEELERRLVTRATDSPENIAKRVAKASQEIEQAHLFDHRVINKHIDKAVKETKALIEDFLTLK